MPLTDPELESVLLVWIADIAGLSRLKVKAYMTSATVAPAIMPSFLSNGDAPIL
jgi:hypothetical protein